jgi:hypothetical protein
MTQLYQARMAKTICDYCALQEIEVRLTKRLGAAAE